MWNKKKTFLRCICTVLLREAVNLNGSFVTQTETSFYSVTFHKGTSNLQNSLSKLNDTRVAPLRVHRLQEIQHYSSKTTTQKTQS